ncbi:predicted protein [Histoplasma capsulatum H143]|uniref:Uncharacterized protein n=1 Tax=Ajellomyces capsulatus (strain H143) TaxID=544712 RepID=C6HEN9_AJECH|nr:predicted protein [Histoplasma capsulatum H143]
MLQPQYLNTSPIIHHSFEPDPTVVLLIYAFYIIHRIRKYKIFVRINRFFRNLIPFPQGRRRAWRGTRRGKSYGPVNANLNVGRGAEFGQGDGLACGDDDHDDGEDGYQEIELQGQMRRMRRKSKRRPQHENPKQGYQLIDFLSSDSDSDSDSDFPLISASDAVLLDTPSNDGDDGCSCIHTHNIHKVCGYHRNAASKQEQLAELDMSKYFDPTTSRLRDNVLLAPKMKIESNGEGRDDEGDMGDMAAWVHRIVDYVVTKLLNWLDD